MTKSTRNALSQIYVRELTEGLSLTAEVSLCVFMFPGYPLQLKVILNRQDGTPGGDAFAVNRNRSIMNATSADVVRLLNAVAIQPCSRCSAPAFDPATIETNRGGLCESCFLQDLNQRLDAEMEQKRRQIARRDRQMKSRGMKYRIAAWIRRGECDYDKEEWYVTSAPSRKSTAARVRREGSTLVDFEVFKL